MAGESSRTISYQKSSVEAFADLNRAFSQIGSVESSSQLTMTVTGKTRFGAQAVKLRVSVLEKNEISCLLEIQAFADDVWGGGARKGTDKLIAALENPNFKSTGCLGAVVLFLTAAGTIAAVCRKLI